MIVGPSLKSAPTCSDKQSLERKREREGCKEKQKERKPLREKDVRRKM